MKYNEEHNITPTAIVKARNAIVGIDDDDVIEAPKQQYKQSRKQTAAVPYANEYTTEVNIAADPVVAMMSREELQKQVDRLRTDMAKAAKNMEFMEAARLRDEMLKLEQRITEM
jgi:excinuclease ABC subunit B